MLWTCTGGFHDVFVCGCAGRPQIKHEPQSAPIFSGSNMRRAPWSSVAPYVRASCYHRGMGERMFELWASTASRVARFCSTHKYVRKFVFASRAGRHWLHERFTRDCHPSCSLVSASVCHMIICGHLCRVLGPPSKNGSVS